MCVIAGRRWGGLNGERNGRRRSELRRRGQENTAAGGAQRSSRSDCRSKTSSRSRVAATVVTAVSKRGSGEVGEESEIVGLRETRKTVVEGRRDVKKAAGRGPRGRQCGLRLRGIRARKMGRPPPPPPPPPPPHTTPPPPPPPRPPGMVWRAGHYAAHQVPRGEIYVL